jgi:amidase
MSAGQLTSASLVEAYLDRIERLDKNNPALNVVLELNPDALKIVVPLDIERAKKVALGPPQGIPIILSRAISTRPTAPFPTSGQFLGSVNYRRSR